MPLLTCEILDGYECQNPECDHTGNCLITVRSLCHPDKPFWPSYNKEDGVLTLNCSECRKPIAHFAIAPDL
jgi:hypothetical protein